MVQDDIGAAQDQRDTARAGQRIQTEIEFPYADLESAVALARAIHANAGASCEDEELAAWLDMSANGGTFRARRSSARMFGLIEVSQGRLSLNTLGRRIVNDAESRAARIEAFLKPALFSAMYEQYRGQALPPAAAIERHMEQLGVPPKQKMRARQVFQKSAKSAGYIDASSGRFVKPGVVAGRESTEKLATEGKGIGGGNDGGSGGSDDPPRHPLIEGLFQSLPKEGESWTVQDAAEWLEAAAVNLRIAYKFKGRIKVTVEGQVGDGAGGGIPATS